MVPIIFFWTINCISPLNMQLFFLQCIWYKQENPTSSSAALLISCSFLQSPPIILILSSIAWIYWKKNTIKKLNWINVKNKQKNFWFSHAFLNHFNKILNKCTSSVRDDVCCCDLARSVFSAATWRDFSPSWSMDSLWWPWTVVNWTFRSWTLCSLSNN